MDFFPSAFDFFNPSSSDNKLIIFSNTNFSAGRIKKPDISWGDFSKP